MFFGLCVFVFVSLPPVCRLASDEVEADQAAHGVGNNHSLLATILLDSMLYQIPHLVKVSCLQAPATYCGFGLRLAMTAACTLSCLEHLSRPSHEGASN